jgi:hypothetical protein
VCVTAELDKKLQGLTSNVDIIKHIVYYMGPISIGDLAAKMAQVMLSFQPDEKSIRQYITPILTKLDYYTEKDGKWEIVLEKSPEHSALPKVMEEEHRLLFEREARSRLATALECKVKSVCIELDRDPHVKKFGGKWGIARWELLNDWAYEVLKKQDSPMQYKEILALVAQAAGKPTDLVVFDPRGDRRFVQERKAWTLRESQEKRASQKSTAASLTLKQEQVELELESSFMQAQAAKREKRGFRKRDEGKIKLRKMMQQEAQQALREREQFVAPVEVDLATELSQDLDFTSPTEATSFNRVEPSIKERSLSPKEREAISSFVNKLIEMDDRGVGLNISTLRREPLSSHKVINLLRLKYLPFFTERVIIPDEHCHFASELAACHPGQSVMNVSAHAGAFATQVLNVVFERLDGAAWAPYGSQIEVAQRDGVRYRIPISGTPLQRKTQEDFLLEQTDLIDYFVENNFVVIEGDPLLAQAAAYSMRLSGYPGVYVAAKDFLSQLPEVFSQRSDDNEVSLRFDLIFGNLTLTKSHNLTANYLDQTVRLLERDGVVAVFVLKELVRLLKGHDFMDELVATHDFRYVCEFPKIDSVTDVLLLVFKKKPAVEPETPAPLVHAVVKDVKLLGSVIMDLARGIRQSAYYEKLTQESVKRVLGG